MSYRENGELVADNKSLGNFRLDGIPKADRGNPQIEVTFDIDVDGLLSVKAKELGTGIEQSVTIQGASTLDQKEIDEMIKSAEKYAEVDQDKRKNVDLKNNAETLCYEASKQLLLSKEKISEEQQVAITKLIEDIKLDIKENKFENLTDKTEQLKMLMKEIIEASPLNDNDLNVEDTVSNSNNS